MLTVESISAGTARSHLDARHGSPRRVDFGADTPPIEVFRAGPVLYVPSALDVGQSAQLLGDASMPIEAVFDDFTPSFVRQRMLKKGVTQVVFEDSTVAGDVCILGNVFSRNFTHWHEELMKLVVLERGGFDCTFVVSELPAFAAELLRLFGVDPGRVLEVRRPVRFRSALYGTPVSYRNVADYPGVLLDLRRRLLAAAGVPLPDVGPRLWLDRGEQTRLGRRLVNPEEVHPLLERYGFERIDMGALPVASQLAVARDARAMSGLHGSGFVHSQVMAPRSWVIEAFSPIYLNPTYTEIYRVLRHRYAQLTATNTPIFPYQHGGDVLVDCQQLELALYAATEAAEGGDA
ncbi:MAG TPA: glycosyltransferase family 61 protein [Gammaproteobacteria bacterium]|nr:glycosyltransferase family 61 protein [Gammaproteobacteria bacterium]